MFICATTSNLNNFQPQQLEPQKCVQNEKKKQNRRPQPRKHTKDPILAPLFFGTMRYFVETFWIAPKGPPSLVSTFCNPMDVKKSQWVPLSHFTCFGTVTLFKNLIFKHFWDIFFKSPKGSPSIFPLLSLRYSTDFGCSQLVICSFFIRYEKITSK